MIRSSRYYLPIVIVAVVWEILPRTGIVDPEMLPPFDTVAQAWYRLLWSGDLVSNGVSSLVNLAAGLSLGVVIGCSLGILMAWYPPFQQFMSPLLRAIYPVPKGALIPVMILWFGLGAGSKIASVFLGCLLPMVLSAFNGARGVEETLIWSAQSLGASRRAVLWQVVMPAAMPEILAGFRNALALSFILLVAAEILVGRSGLGYLISFLGEGGAYDGMFAGLITVSAVGFLADRCYLIVMRRALQWRELMKWRMNWLGLTSTILVLGTWEVVTRLNFVPHFLLPPLSSVLLRLWADAASGVLDMNLLLTLVRAMAGLALGATAGIIGGLAIARIATVRWFFYPLISLGLPTPKIAFLPIFVLWFGALDVSNIIMVAFSSMFPVIVNAVAGVEGVERVYLWSARSLGAKPWQPFYEIELFAALPPIFTGLQIALPIALIVEVVSEMAMEHAGSAGRS